jgi:high-affinity iron transporter
MNLEAILRPSAKPKVPFWLALALVGLAIAGLLVWLGITSAGDPNPTAPGRSSLAGILDIGILVFREGLECILVLSAITASMARSQQPYLRPVAAGAGVGFLATLATWFVAITIVDSLSENLNALAVQAGTGLLAIFVLLLVMNWFFHKVYWTGWISAHNKRKRNLLEGAGDGSSVRKVLLGMALLGFTSFYREGVEVVLFLQSYRLKLGGEPILYGVILGLVFTVAVAILTFAAHRKLHYRKMLVFTGVMLGVVLLVMVGEQVQEMQLAQWLPTTTIPALARITPSWMGLWFSFFPNVETLVAQGIAAVLVVGSYLSAARPKARPSPRVSEERRAASGATAQTDPIS